MNIRKRLFGYIVPLSLADLLGALLLSNAFSSVALTIRTAPFCSADAGGAAPEHYEKTTSAAGACSIGRWLQFVLNDRGERAAASMNSPPTLLSFDFMVMLDNQQHVVTEQWLRQTW